jgi:hypothetical protein
MKVWFKYDANSKPEVIDDLPKQEAQRCLYEYMMAHGVLPGQHRHGKSKVWMGLRRDEPRDEP